MDEHRKQKYEDEYAELDFQPVVANLMAHCTMCKAKVAEFCARARAALKTRAKVIEESKSRISFLGFSEPVSMALRLWMAQLTALIPQGLSQETRDVDCTTAQPFRFVVCLSR